MLTLMSCYVNAFKTIKRTSMCGGLSGFLYSVARVLARLQYSNG